MDPSCCVCKKKSKGRYLTLAVRNIHFRCNLDEHLCAKCFYRLPHSLQTKVHKSSKYGGSGDEIIEFNELIISALRNTNNRLKLRDVYCILFESAPSHFEKFYSQRAFKERCLVAKINQEEIYGFYYIDQKIEPIEFLEPLM